MLHRKLLIFILIFNASLHAFSVTLLFEEKLQWQPIQKIKITEGMNVSRLVFEGASFNKLQVVPHFVKNYPLYSESVVLHPILSDLKTVPVTPEEKALLSEANFKDTSFTSRTDVSISRKMPFARVDVVPVRWNDQQQIFEKLVSFTINIEVNDVPEADKIQEISENSVLSSGDWFKVRVNKSGVFKVTYQQLSDMGFNVGADPRKFAVFGNGGGVLPEKNTDFRYDDLHENPIQVVGESDGSFDPNDYILFYASGPVKWKYDPVNGVFYHQTNYYDDYAYYFLTVLPENGKRLQQADKYSGVTSNVITKFTDYDYHEIDLVNLAGTGRIWYGETYDFNASDDFEFDFPNAVTSEMAYFKGDFAAVAETPSQFEITPTNNQTHVLVMPTISPTGVYQIGRGKSTSFEYKMYGDHVTVNLNYLRTSTNSSGYLNYMELNVKRQLKMSSGQLMFREYLPTGDTVKYKLASAGQGVSIWEVTDPVNPEVVSTTAVGGNLEFNSSTSKLREFVAFDGTEFYTVEFVEKLANQNLHSVRDIDYLIVSHPDFLDQANRLADYHRSTGMSVFVTTPGLIYNEFASGASDLTGIRDFAKRLYDISEPGKELKYLLLFGDASYDYKYINQNVADYNFVPCWESLESLNIVWSIASDDYFGYLDDGEGDPNSDAEYVDIGIGRFVVSTPEEAKMAVDKSLHYSVDTPEVMGPWRTLLTFLADDEDSNTHLSHAEYLSDYVKDYFPLYNIDKIYLDAYTQVSTPAGQRAPEMNSAVNQRVEKGTLIINYNGHGGEVGLGHERFLTLADINSWENYDRLPIFITATCEFSRYDDPTRISAGEQAFLNQKGGAIALFSTARATFASSNLSLNAAIYENNIFTKVGGEYPRFGDVIRQSKVLGGENDKKFVLLGDPACRLAYPEYGVKTIKINDNVVVEGEYDTIRALEKVKVNGLVVDDNGATVTDFNGTLFPTVYDKYSEIQTFGDKGTPTTFLLRKNILFNGKASIENGVFEFEFVVPKDIAYNFGPGRISYYLNNDEEDGAGYYEGIIIGGYDENAYVDNEGPLINLYMNDTTFVTGDITDENPVLLAKLFDESGINTTGNGIGHDIIATIDSEKSQNHTLNEYYEANRDNYTSGTINYPFSKLEDGEHTLSLKAWDIYNNSSTAYLKFLVTSSNSLVIQNLLNYPNPFTETTNFVFDHNQSGEPLDVKIYIYNSAGAHIKTIETQLIPEGYKSTPITWDGTTDAGGKIGRGFYVYRTVVQNEKGETAIDQSKLVFVR